ncbi:YaaC family protein [Halalkalibacterium ligniniphilum]|uniref:YaaC family protein n=1 Tax=Halalkalibacterium ligniniphilum TaxID=1134413 RepID=UPI00034937E7|nr:YaaC family protein [Halalkalibacterium ligniniphilum]
MGSNAWEPLLPFFSVTYTRRYLANKYERAELFQANTKSYQTCYSFIYHLQHGKLFIEQAEKAPYELRPILLFYGLVQLIKACVLTKDPQYPETSQVLAHGVSTRKRKKSGYRFLEDEVKTQRNGLFSHLLDKLFHMKQLEGEKFCMEQLLLQLPELYPTIQTVKNKEYAHKCYYKQGNLYIPASLLDDFHMTIKGLEHFLSLHNPLWLDVNGKIELEKNWLRVPVSHSFSPYHCFPFLYESKTTGLLLRNRDKLLKLPSIAVHYLLLYNLSMICRYETEWWGELFHTFDGGDLPIILQLLDSSSEAIPNRICLYLQEGC